MESRQASASHEDVFKFVTQLREKGIRLWLAEGEVRYRAPKNTLTSADVERIRECRDEVIDLLRLASPGASGAEQPGFVHDGPLAYSQLQHWNFYNLYERTALRHLVHVLSLRGALDLQAFRLGIDEVVRRHEALRTQILVREGEPIQRILQSRTVPLVEADLSSLPAAVHLFEIDRNLTEMVLTPIDVANDPLWEVRLLRFAEHHHALLIVMDHIISDMWSMDVFVRDLFTAYEQVRSTGRTSLPDVPMQLSEYALWQQRREALWLDKHRAYWDERLRGCGRLRFPDEPSGTALGQGWGSMPLVLNGELRARLQSWCKESKITMVMGVFAAYIAAVFRWCGTSDAVMRFESNGRINARVEQTIGYFTAPLYLRIQMEEGDRFSDLVRRVSEEYCNANEHADASYIESRMPRFEFTRNPALNWIPQLGHLEVPQIGAAESLTCSVLNVENPRLRELHRDTEPFAIFFEKEEEIEAAIWYPRERLSEGTMRAFAECFLVFIEQMVAEPGLRVGDVRWGQPISTSER